MLDWNAIREWNNFLWYWYSNIVMFVPMTFLLFHKLLNPIDWNILKKSNSTFKRSFGDKFLTIITPYCLIYYAVDSTIKVMTKSYTGCDISMLLHHTFSLIYLPTVCFVRYWPWFWLAPGTMHTFLLAFPDASWLNYIYITIVGLFQYGLYQKPFSDLKEYNRMKVGIVCIEFACLLFWLFGCSNRLVAREVDQDLNKPQGHIIL